MNDSIAAIERAMGRIRRSQARRTLGRLAEQQVCGPQELSLVPVLDAVEQGPGSAGQEITVGLVADRLGLDPSRASRMVAAAIQAGYVRRVASQSDGRRIHLELTESGAALVAEAHKFRQAFFARALTGWSEQDLADLARLLTRFTEDLANTQTC